jgi:hypothetical protein
VDVHETVNLADVGRRRTSDGDYNSVVFTCEVVLLEQEDWKTVLCGVGVDCLLVGSICAVDASAIRTGRIFTSTNRDLRDMGHGLGLDFPSIRWSVHDIDPQPELATGRSGTDISNERILDRCPLAITKLRSMRV